MTFILNAVPDNVGTTTIGTPTTVTIGTVGEVAVRTFTATAGQSVSLAVTGNTIAGVDLTVLNPSGATVATLFASGATATRSAFTLAVTGTYTITVDPRHQLVGDADVHVGSELTTMKTSIVCWLLCSLFATAAVAHPDTTSDDPPSLTFSAEQLLANDRPGPANESPQTLTITGVRTGANSHGTATFANGVITFTPDAGFFGTAVIFYTACDNGTTNGQAEPRCSETTITINVIANRPPAANSQPVLAAEDSSATVTLTASDPDGDPVQFTIVTPPSHGTLTGTAPALTYVPAPNFHGFDTFTFAANDGTDQSAPATVAITVTEVNDPPAPQPDLTTVGAGSPVTLPTAFLLTNDVRGPFDEASQTLTVTAVTAGANTHGTASLSAGVVTYTPDSGFVGAAVIAYTVCDNGTTNGVADPRCTDSTLTIVLNGPPVAHGQSAETTRSAPLPLVLNSTDPEDDALTYAIVAPPQHGTLSGTLPAVTYVANTGFVGNDGFTFRAADAYSTSNTATVSIVVKDLPPVTLGQDSFTVAAGGSVLVDVLANDVAGTGTMDAATLTISSPPTRGAAVVETGKIRYTPNAGASGADGFAYTGLRHGRRMRDRARRGHDHHEPSADRGRRQLPDRRRHDSRT